MPYVAPKNETEAFKQVEKLIGKIASKWARNHRKDYQDLYNEGVVGAMIAFEKYQPQRGIQFNTYAYAWISAYVSTAAKKNWELYNNTASEELSDWMMDGEYEINDTLLSVQMELEKLGVEDQRIFTMKMEGFTFDEISKELGLGSLHKARNRYVAIEEKVGA